MSTELKVLEFYSGIGGWSFALENLHQSSSSSSSSTILHYKVLASFDINTIANDVYLHNHHIKPIARSIDQLTIQVLDKYAADMWVMSPPCQPFTRNNTTFTRDMNDPRTTSFLHLLTQLETMTHIPTYIALENVIGFESSVCCERFIEVLKQRKYQFRQFHINPSQYCIPNERPRYYCLAWQGEDHLNVGTGEEILKEIPGVIRPDQEKSLNDYVDHNLSPEELAKLVVPMSLIKGTSAAWCFDIRDHNSTTSACFTKSYTRYIKGTGSILYFTRDSPLELPKEEKTKDTRKRSLEETAEAEERNVATSQEPKPEPSTDIWWHRYVTEDYQTPLSNGTYAYFRYFSSKELLGLFGFPTRFQFPEHAKVKKQYELIGNSVNVTIVGYLLDVLLKQSCKA